MGALSMNEQALQHSTDAPGAYDVDTLCAAFKISRSQFYKELKANRIRAYKIGKRTFVSYDAAQDWQKLLESKGFRPFKIGPKSLEHQA
jgi:hypothetical protein